MKTAQFKKRANWKVFYPLLTLCMIFITGCTDSGVAVQVDGGPERIQSPNLLSGEMEKLVSGCTAFGLELFQNLRTEGQNLFLSPLSISWAMAMVYAGAKNETEAEIAAGMHFDLPKDRLPPVFNHLEGELSSRGEGAMGVDDEPFRLRIVNSHWAAIDYEFLEDFLNTLALHYGSAMFLVDFLNNAEKARTDINEWVEEMTEGLIKDLIPEGLINQTTKLVLVNAIYFNAAWQNKFKESNTTKRPFFSSEGEEVIVDFMFRQGYYFYAEVDGVQIVQIPYDGNELSMVILLPGEGLFDEEADILDVERLGYLLGETQAVSVNLRMPKFGIESDFNLKDALESMGIEQAFEDPFAHHPGADFSGMTGSQNLFIDEVIHKTFVEVDENGTEAAAATAVIMGDGGLAPEPPDPVEMNINRPFIFFIRDHATGAIPFIGQVVNPA